MRVDGGHEVISFEKLRLWWHDVCPVENGMAMVERTVFRQVVTSVPL